MGPKKNHSKNGFVYFMGDVRKREKENGRRFGDKKELAEFASPLWNSLDSRAKQAYNEIASKVKSTKGVDNSTRKFNSMGVSYAIQDAEERELEEYNLVMRQTIITTVRSLDVETTLKAYRFYLCHINYFYKTDCGNFCPAEIALSEFSLGEGLVGRLHFFVNPGTVPLGLKFEARQWSEKTHGLPIVDWSQGISDYNLIYTKIVSFLSKGSSVLPPVYTMPDSLNNNFCLAAVKNTFYNLAEVADQNPDIFRIYPLPLLLFELWKKSVDDSKDFTPSLAMVENEIEKDIFARSIDLGCNFHEENDLGLHCSLSIVTRWVYMICDHCCEHLNIQPVRGKHYPKDKHFHIN